MLWGIDVMNYFFLVLITGCSERLPVSLVQVIPIVMVEDWEIWGELGLVVKNRGEGGRVDNYGGAETSQGEGCVSRLEAWGDRLVNKLLSLGSHSSTVSCGSICFPFMISSIFSQWNNFS